MRRFLPHIITLSLLFGACPLYAQIGKVETGIASFYHDKFVGRKTANGEIFTQDKLTAAHKTLPLGTWVRVTNLSNDSVVVVRINDRMPKSNGRSIDLTEKAAGQLNFIPKGLTKVRIEIIPAPDVVLPPKDLPTEPIACIQVAALPLSQLTHGVPVDIRYPFDWTAYKAEPPLKKRR